MGSDHPLKAWIESRMSLAEFARQLGVSGPHLSLVLQGKRGLSLGLAVEIERFTDGEFTAARLHQEQMARSAHPTGGQP